MAQSTFLAQESFNLVNPLAVTPSPPQNDATLSVGLASIGSANASLLLGAGTWTIANHLTIPSNVHLLRAAGAKLSIAGGITLTLNCSEDGPLDEWLIGTGLVRFGSRIPTVYPEWFGAKGDGTTDCTTAFQRALTATAFADSPPIQMTAGTFMIASPLEFRTYNRLKGVGRYQSILKTTVGFATGSAAGDTLCRIGNNTDSFQSGISLEALHLDTSSNAALTAIRPNQTFPTKLTNSQFSYLNITGARQVAMDTYTQWCDFTNILSLGDIEFCLQLRGNVNRVNGWDKEGSTGAGTSSYFSLRGIDVPGFTTTASRGNHLKGILVQQSTSTNKVAIEVGLASVAGGALDTILEDLWLEPTLSADWNVVIKYSPGTQIKGQVRWTNSSGAPVKIYVQESSISIDYMDTDISTGQELTEHFEILGNSHIFIGTLYSRLAASSMPIELLPKVTIGRIVNRTLINPGITGQAPVSIIQDAGPEMALNGHFSAGDYGWAISPAPDVNKLFNPSEVTPGRLQAQLVWASPASPTISQNIAITAEQVGKPLTLTIKARAVAGSGAGLAWVVPFTTGAGVSDNTTTFRHHLEDGWGIISRTIVPTAAATLVYGCRGINVTNMLIDSISLRPGTHGVPYDASVSSLDIQGLTFVTAAAMPTTGVWKAGSYVKNSAPFIDGNLWVLQGWVRLTTGSGHVLNVDWAQDFGSIQTLVAQSALVGTATPTLGTINAQTVSTFTITVTGVLTTHTPLVSPTGGEPGVGLTWSARVTATDTVTVRVANPTAGNIVTTNVVWTATIRP